MSSEVRMDWSQVVANGGPPCFFVEGPQYCGRAERWQGHGNAAFHDYVSLEQLLATAVRADLATSVPGETVAALVKLREKYPFVDWIRVQESASFGMTTAKDMITRNAVINIAGMWPDQFTGDTLVEALAFALKEGE